MNYTKGEWKSGYKGKQCFIVWQDDVGIIADVYVLNSEWLDNARLISAAPELYEALKKLINGQNLYGDKILYMPELWDNAKKALAKAEGKNE